MSTDLSFKQFQKLLSEIEQPTLLQAIAPQILRYRQAKYRMLPAEDGYMRIWDWADQVTDTKRSSQQSAAGGSPNRDRYENAKKGKGDRQTVEAVYFAFLTVEPDETYAEAISQELLGGAQFFEHFNEDLRKMRVRIPSSGDGLDQFQFGNVTLWLTHRSDAQQLELPLPNLRDIVENGTLAPFEALHWRNDVTDLYGRDGELNEILKWATNPEPRATLHLLSGRGGAGKTRLAGTAAKLLKAKGWKAGFLPTNADDTTIHLSLDACGVGALLIVDYPEERPKLVKKLLEVASTNQEYPVPVRLLLVSREGEQAFRDMTEAQVRRISTTSLETSSVLSVSDAMLLIHSAAKTISEALDIDQLDVSSAEDWLKRDEVHRLPLFALASVVHASTSLDSAFRLAGSDLLQALVRIEISRVRRYSTRDLSVSDYRSNRKSLERLLALGVLSGRGVTENALRELGRLGIVPGLNDHELVSRSAKTPFWARPQVSQVRGHLKKIEPDILAAVFFKEVFLGGDGPLETPSWMACTARDALDGFNKILGRLSYDIAQVDPLASQQIEKLAIDMLEAAPELHGHFSFLVGTRASVFSSEFMVKLIDHFLAKDNHPGTNAQLLLFKSNCLSDLNEKTQALATIQEAARILRLVSQLDPSNYRHVLARSLNNISNRLFDLNEVEPGLEVSTEAVNVWQKVDERNEERVLGLGVSLDSLANRLSDAGRIEEALRVSSEAVKHFQRYFAEEDIEFLIAYSNALHNLANKLFQGSRIAESLETISMALNVMRKLTDIQPDVHLPNYLVISFNYADNLAISGNHNRAREVADWGVKKTDAIFQARPHQFRPLLAYGLKTLTLICDDQRDIESAITHGERAVGLYRDLADENPKKYIEDFLHMLSNVATFHAMVGQDDLAKAYAVEAVSLKRKTNTFTSKKFVHLLANCFNTLAQLHLRCSEFETAEEFAAEACRIYEKTSGDGNFAEYIDWHRSQAALAKALASNGKKLEAAEAFFQAMKTLELDFRNAPEAFAQPMYESCLGYIDLCQELGVEQDLEFVQPIADILNELMARKRQEIST